MNKEEILKKAQSRKPNQMDEMEMDIFQKSSYIGMTVGLSHQPPVQLVV